MKYRMEPAATLATRRRPPPIELARPAAGDERSRDGSEGSTPAELDDVVDSGAGIGPGSKGMPAAALSQ